MAKITMEMPAGEELITGKKKTTERPKHKYVYRSSYRDSYFTVKEDYLPPPGAYGRVGAFSTLEDLFAEWSLQLGFFSAVTDVGYRLWTGHSVVPQWHPWINGERRKSLDFAIPELKIGIELEGGTFMAGRHSRGTGYAADCLKLNALQADGWMIWKMTGDMFWPGYSSKGGGIPSVEMFHSLRYAVLTRAWDRTYPIVATIEEAAYPRNDRSTVRSIGGDWAIEHDSPAKPGDRVVLVPRQLVLCLKKDGKLGSAPAIFPDPRNQGQAIPLRSMCKESRLQVGMDATVLFS
jgi:hypothetical protein